MFSTKELDINSVDESIIISLNTLFNYLTKYPLNNFKELVDQKLLLSLCLEMDNPNYDHFQKSFIFDKNLGIFYAEMKEIISNMIESLRKMNVNFRYTFNKDFETINVNNLIKYENAEVKKLVNLIILFLFNCPEKNNFIDKIANFEEFQQQELLKIVERYMLLDEQIRESINNFSSRNISNRNTITNDFLATNINLLESEIASRYVSKMDNLEKEKNNLEIKVNENESEMTKQTKEIARLISENKKLEDNLNKYSLDVIELKKTNTKNLQKIKELEDLSKEPKIDLDYRSKIEEREAEISYLNYCMNEIKLGHENEIRQLLEKIEIMQDNISNLSDMKLKYEKMGNMMKEYEATKEKVNYYDTMSKELSKLKNNYLTLQQEKQDLENEADESQKKLADSIKLIEKLNLENSSIKAQLEVKQKLELELELQDKNKNFNQSNQKKFEIFKGYRIETNKLSIIADSAINKNRSNNKNEDYIKIDLLNNTIKYLETKILELEGRNLGLEENVSFLNEKINTVDKKRIIKENPKEVIDESKYNEQELLSIIKLKEETIKLQQETLNFYSQKLKNIENDNNSIRNNLENEIIKRIEELDNAKKENSETKERYEKEFELIASSIYNLGLTYWSMKMEYAQKLSEKPNWLIKERQKYYNGDF